MMTMMIMTMRITMMTIMNNSNIKYDNFFHFPFFFMGINNNYNYYINNNDCIIKLIMIIILIIMVIQE